MTGVIYIVIIALWAAVLIPLWLRRHDQISEVRSTARFHSAMRSLGSSRVHAGGEFGSSSRGAVAMGDYADDDSDQSYDDMRRRMDAIDHDEVSRAAATRRALVLGTLSSILLVTLLLAVLGVLPRWVPALAVLPVIGFLIAQSMTASQRSAGARPAATTFTTRDRRPRSAGSAADSAAPAAATRSVQKSKSQADEEWENWNAWDDDDSWDAVPTTLPTYVTAPRASAVPRRIDRSRPGEWTGSAMVETAQAMLASEGAAAAASEPGKVDSAAMTAEIPVVRAPAQRVVNG